MQNEAFKPELLILCKYDGPGAVSSTGTHPTADPPCQEGMTQGSLLLYLPLSCSSFPKHLFRDGLQGSFLWRSEWLHKATGCSLLNSFFPKISSTTGKQCPRHHFPKLALGRLINTEQENKKKP